MDRDVSTFLDLGAPGLGERWAALLERGGSFGALDRLRRELGPAMARFVSLQLELADRSTARFPDQRLAFWTSKGLEQATAPAVADYRAGLFRQAVDSTESPSPSGGGTPRTVVWDAACGVGADTVALARTVPRLVSSDLDPASVRCSAANVQIARERGAESMGSVAVVRADLLRPPLVEFGAATPRIFGLFDPDRRPGGEREARPERWSPPLDAVGRAALELTGACIKLPPGLDPAGIERWVEAGDGRRETERGSPAIELRWVALDGELKELMALTGSLGGLAHGTRPAGDGRAGPARCAVGLTRSGGDPVHFRGSTESMPESAHPEALREGRWLVDLDVSLWQSGLAGAYARAHGMEPLDAGASRGYLLADRDVEAGSGRGLARAWRVLGTASADPRRVRDLLRRFDVGPLVVKKRNHPDPADTLARKLRGHGSRRGLLAVTRLGRRSLAILLESPSETSLPARGASRGMVGDEGIEPPTSSV